MEEGVTVGAATVVKMGGALEVVGTEAGAVV